jgi:hypothetical protein
MPEIVGGAVFSGGTACADAAPSAEAQTASPAAIAKRPRSGEFGAFLPVSLIAKP